MSESNYRRIPAWTCEWFKYGFKIGKSTTAECRPFTVCNNLISVNPISNCRRAKEKRLKKDAGRTRWSQYFRSMKGGSSPRLDKLLDKDDLKVDLDSFSHGNVLIDFTHLLTETQTKSSIDFCRDQSRARWEEQQTRSVDRRVQEVGCN